MKTRWMEGVSVVRGAGFLLLIWGSANAALSQIPAQDVVRIYWPADGAVFVQPTNVPLTIQILVTVASEAGARTDIYDGTNYIGFTNLERHHVLAWSDVAFGEHELFAIHRLNSGPVTSSVARVRVDYGGWAMVRPGSVWHYRDGGVDLGTEWRGTNVDVSEWLLGPAKLGFGDDDVVTYLNWFNPTNGSAFPTYYFRHVFTPPAGSAVSNLAVRLRRDDGAIVYWNGEELFRDNMPEGEVNYWTYALGAVSDEVSFIQRWVNPARLRPGPNYIAVEIHNLGPFAGDVGFDLAVVADIPQPPPALDVQLSGTNILVSWPEGYDGYRLDSAESLRADGSGWETVTNRLATIRGRLVHTNRTDVVARFFRLTLE